MGIAPQATQQEIKAAYRRLAHQYHPDKNAGNHYATQYFQDIHEAYELLSQPRRRAAYDEERSLAGYQRYQKADALTPARIYNECVKLVNHVSTVDTFRMSQTALHEYTQMLLSDTHFAILNRAADAALNREIIRAILQATKHMHYPYFLDISTRLETLAGDDDHLKQGIQQALTEKKQDMWMRRAKPWAILLIALLICAGMALYL